MSGDVRLRREFIATVVLLVLLALLPLVTRDVYWLGVLVVSAYFAILASSWNLLAGFTGQFSLAPAAFAMIGAYGAALSAAYYNVPPLLGLLIGTASAGLIGLVLGRIVMRLRGPYLELLALLPKAQGQGVGASILAWFEQEALKLGARNLWVCASSFNTDALRFYGRHGFHPAATLPGLVADGYDEILLRKFPLGGS